MSLTKDPYVPSPFTLTLLDNFGTRRLLHRPQTNVPPSMSHHRSEVRIRPAYDKEALLEQLRKEKMKARQMNASSGYLRRQLSQSKQHPHPVPSSIPVHRSIESSLKRELESLLTQLQSQSAQISRIKTSKKYNRYIELITAKEVYQQELKQVAKRTAKNRYALRERKRMWVEHCRREQDTHAIDRNVKSRLQQENKELEARILEEDGRIRLNLERQAAQLRERSRLVRDILQLQKATGKLYIMEREEVENEETMLSPPPDLYSKQEETGKKAFKDAESSNENYQSEEQQQEQDDFSSEEDESAPSSIQAPRRHNVSF